MFQKFQEINEIRVTEKSTYLLIHKKGPIAKSAILRELGGGPFIFNLGHGIVPQTPLDHVEAMLEQIRGWTATERRAG